MVVHLLTTVGALGAAATGGTAVPNFGAGMHKFNAGRLVCYLCRTWWSYADYRWHMWCSCYRRCSFTKLWKECMSYIGLFFCLLQEMREVRLLQEVQFRTVDA